MSKMISNPFRPVNQPPSKTFAQNAHDSESLCSGLMGIGNYESVTGLIGFNGHRGLATVPGIFVLKGSQSLRVK